MKRRELLKTAGISAIASVIAKPALAQAMPELRWRLTSSFSKSLDILYGASEVFAKTVAQASDGKFQIQVFSAGEIVPGLSAADAVQNGTVEICHTGSYYFVSKDPTFAFGTSVPFGLNARMQNAWMYFGGGMDLLNNFYKKFNIYAIPAGNTGAQMAGWFRKEVRDVSDFNGLKIRIGGIAAMVLQKLGAIPQQIAGGDLYPALEKGTIDAAEWIGPYDDEKLGFYKVAQYYYYPGWWEGCGMLHNFINLNKWNELSSTYKAIIRAASALADNWMQAKYDASNPGALKRLVAGGAQLRPLSQGVLEASYKAANEVYTDTSRTNADFKQVYDSLITFRGDEYLWSQVSEYTFDTFQIRARRN
jgi:TRAP-type mannitol/chloroaromatic compound transport system substrate-binding protein